MADQILTANRLRELLDYNTETGLFTHRLARSGVQAGTIAGSVSNVGYIYIRVDGKKYSAHRLAFLHVTGVFPSKCVDHIDGNRKNNVFANLRLATISQNSFNAIKRADNTSGCRGVSWIKAERKWVTRAYIDGKEIRLGRYSAYEDAAAAYVSFAEEHHGDFYRDVATQI